MLGTATAAEVVVFAAAILKEAFDEAAGVYDHQSGDTVKISYAATSALAKQIESGTPADMFVSANLDWMDYLQQRISSSLQPGRAEEPARKPAHRLAQFGIPARNFRKHPGIVNP
jgi:hypothetical protein